MQYVYPQKVVPGKIDNYLFSLYYSSGKNAYNMRGLKMASVGSPIAGFKVNPSGTSFAVIERNKDGKTELSVYSIWKSNTRIHTFKDVHGISAIAYTPDARYLAYATPGNVNLVDARNFQEAFDISIENDTAVSNIVFSPDAKTMAVSGGREVIIYDVMSKHHRSTIEFDADIVDTKYSNDNDFIAVLTDDGVLHLYDSVRYLTMGSIEGLGSASSLSFNPDDKYVSAVIDDKRIVVVNRLDSGEREFVEDETGDLSNAVFVKDNKGNLYLAYIAGNNIIYRSMSALPPNFTKLLADELKDKMNEWLKMMPGESLEDYDLRVTEESRMAQIKLFEQEIATRMADNMLALSEVSLGDYSPETSTLILNFDNMPSVFLEVPENELMSFSDSDALEFTNAKYGINSSDKFELIYVDVYNKSNGKTYTFDNLGRQSLAFLTANENFVPLELIQQNNLEEIKLQNIKDNIISLAKQQDKLSDHTRFNVESRIVPSTDNAGRKIMNYQIDFSYDVDRGFSAKEDFPPGRYTVGESHAAESMLKIIKTALESDFAQYIRSGKDLVVTITGMADALSINGKIQYNGIYGDFKEEPVYKDDDLMAITVEETSGIMDNDQLAFLRATGVKDFISSNIKGLDLMNVDYRTRISISDGKGGEFRRIKVVLTFLDALKAE